MDHKIDLKRKKIKQKILTKTIGTEHFGNKQI